MKLLYLRTVHWFNLKGGGSVGHTAGVINALSKKIDITVFSNDKLVGVHTPVNILPTVKIPGNSLRLREILYSLKLIHTFKSHTRYNVIYQRYSGFSFCSAYLARKNNVCFVLEYNSSHLWTLRNWRKPPQEIGSRMVDFIFHHVFWIPLVSLIESYNIKAAHLIVVVSNVLKENLMNTGVPEEKILVVPNGIDAKKFSPDIDGMEIREKFGLNKKTVVGFIGTFGQWHGVIEMAHAIVLFLKNNHQYHRRVKFLLIGDGVLFKKVFKIIKSSSVSDNVIFTGLIPQDESPKYLSACDILLSPHVPNPDGTRFFGSPTKIFEYMGMGKAIIASNLEQIGEILKHKITAYLVPPGDVQALEKAIKTLVDDVNLRNQIGVNAYREVLMKYTWDHNVSSIIRYLERLHLSEKI